MTVTLVPKLQIRKVRAHWWVCENKIPLMRFEMFESAVTAVGALNAKRYGHPDRSTT